MQKSNRTVTKQTSKSKRKISRSERADQSRDRILQAAIRLFAQHGYDAVSVDEVVARARINKRMVYHYFGNKNGLYSAALANVYSLLAKVEATVFRDKPSVPDAIEHLVRAYFRFLQDTPEFVSLLLWENLQGGKHLSLLDRAVTKAPILEALNEVIQQGIKSRQIRPGIEPKHLLINLIGLCQVYFSNRHTLMHSIGLDLNDPTELEKGIQQAIALVKNGILRQR